MICRKCGAILPDNAIRCSNCGIKVNMVCPECKTLNPFGTKHCKKCGFELIKTCPECNCSNIYSASECRKCKTPFLKKEPNSIELDIVRPISCSSPSNYTPGLDEQIVTPLHQDEQTEINPVEKTTEIEKIFNENFEQPAAVPDTKETIQETNINTDEIIQQPEIIDTTVITEDTEDTNVQEKDITEEEPAALLTEESKEEIIQTILQEESPKEISKEETKQKTEEELIEKNPEEPSEPQTLQLESVPDIQKNEIPVHEELINNIEDRKSVV